MPHPQLAVMKEQIRVVLLILASTCAQQQVVIRVGEGISTNVNILCDLDRQFYPLYWRIQERIYDLYTIPEIFIVSFHGAIALPTVDRRMDGWRFQCFTVEPNNKDYLNSGAITELRLVYGM